MGESAADGGPWPSQTLAIGNVMDFAGDDFVNASRDMLQNLFANASGIIAANVTAEYQRIQLADTLVYTALTLTIPVKPLSDDAKVIDIRAFCTVEGCP